MIMMMLPLKVMLQLQRMSLEAAGLGVVVRGAGWQVAHCYCKPLEQPLSQRSHLSVPRQPSKEPLP
jgi:hypothetical protein